LIKSKNPDLRPEVLGSWFDCRFEQERGALPRLRDDADIGLWRLPALRIDFLGVLIADRAGDDDVLSLFPIGGRGNVMLRCELQRVDRAQDLLEVATRAHRIN